MDMNGVCGFTAQGNVITDACCVDTDFADFNILKVGNASLNAAVELTKVNFNAGLLVSGVVFVVVHIARFDLNAFWARRGWRTSRWAAVFLVLVAMAEVDTPIASSAEIKIFFFINVTPIMCGLRSCKAFLSIEPRWVTTNLGGGDPVCGNNLADAPSVADVRVKFRS